MDDFLAGGRRFPGVIAAVIPLLLVMLLVAVGPAALVSCGDSTDSLLPLTEQLEDPGAGNPNEDPGADPPEEPADETVLIDKGPYLQNMTPTSVTIMWETDTAATSEVRYGPDTTYGESVTRDELVTVHEVRLTGLAPASRYHYQVVSARLGAAAPGELAPRVTGESPDATFYTAPGPEGPFVLGAYGDSRFQADVHAAVSTSLARRIEAVGDPALVLHTGDFVSSGLSYEQWGTDFFTPAATLLRSVPLYPCLGNHEFDASWYYTFFAPPSAASGSTTEAWYAFDYGCAHVIALDTCQDFSPDGAQYDWLVRNLASPAAADAAWRFVFFHYPPFSSGSHGGNPFVARDLVPVFQEYGVTIVFCGHDHIYERSFKDVVFYVTTGGGGASLYSVRVDERANPYRIYAEATYHYCIMRVTPNSLVFEARNVNEELIDGFSL